MKASLWRTFAQPLSLSSLRHTAAAPLSYSPVGPANYEPIAVNGRYRAVDWMPGSQQRTPLYESLQEEINLTLPRNAIMGRLDDYITRSGYRITPVVLWSGEESDHLKPNPDEVASIHTVSFKELANPSAPQFEEIPESDRKVLSMRLSVDQIYAPTAAFLYQFREVGILGKNTRVLHYDQPRFAWK